LILEDDIVPYTTIAKGVFYNPIPGTILYHRTIPLSFVVDLPRVSSEFIKSTCTSEQPICKLQSETEGIHSLLLTEVLEEHPYLNVNPARNRRGWFDGVGNLYHVVFGVATDNQIDNLHMSQFQIQAKQNELEDNLVKDHKYVASAVLNICESECIMENGV
jgi:hypothetical protein